jgi:hypothetical protein
LFADHPQSFTCVLGGISATSSRKIIAAIRLLKPTNPAFVRAGERLSRARIIHFLTAWEKARRQCTTTNFALFRRLKL